MSQTVKPGYKQTEVGLIPEDWEMKSLGAIAELTSSKRIFENDYVSFGIPFYRGKEISMLVEGETIDDVCYISEARFNGFKTKFGAPARDDILITAVGTLGNVYVVNTDEPFYFKDGNLIWLRGIKGVEPSFLGIQLRRAKAAILGGAIGTSQKALTIVVLRNLTVAVPPLPEQRAIATALSDVDALLAAQDRLIAKQRDIKQAAMQQLLTGQTRLPGFKGKWETKRLGDVGIISGSGVDKKLRPDETPVRLLNYMDAYRKDFIFSKDLDHWVTAPPHQLRRCAVQKGDVFFTPSSETRNDIANSAVAMEDIPDAAYSYHIVRLRLTEPWDLHFRAYAFKTKAFFDQAETICDGGGTRYVISQGKFRTMTVLVPPLPEQTAIAAVLTDMDATLSALEQRRDKTRALKQGMMQELLTGRTRLV